MLAVSAKKLKLLRKRTSRLKLMPRENARKLMKQQLWPKRQLRMLKEKELRPMLPKLLVRRPKPMLKKKDVKLMKQQLWLRKRLRRPMRQKRLLMEPPKRLRI